MANVETSNGNAGSKYTQSAARTISGRCSSGTGFALAIMRYFRNCSRVYVRSGRRRQTDQSSSMAVTLDCKLLSEILCSMIGRSGLCVCEAQAQR